MQTNIRIQIYTYIHAYMLEFIHKNKPPPLSHRPQTKGKMIFIHSFNPDISIAPLQVHYYSEALPTTIIDIVGVYTTKRYTGNRIQYIQYIIYIIYRRTCPRSLAWRLERDSNRRPSDP